MKKEEQFGDKELYQQLRRLSWDQLWTEEVKRFDLAREPERTKRVAVVRAVGVVFAESGRAEQLEEVKAWLRRLLHDPSEKVRRYAIGAIPKVGSTPQEEAELLALLRRTTGAREKGFLGKALGKVGGISTLQTISKAPGLLPQAEQKVKAAVARAQAPSVIKLDRALPQFTGLRIMLRGRRGLEALVRAEVEEAAQRNGKFKVVDGRSGWVAITPVAPFTLGDLYALRCFDTFGFVLGSVDAPTESRAVEGFASMITSALARRLFRTFTEGAMRYRLSFMGKGHQRNAVRQIADRSYAICPEILNDAQSAPWSVDIYPAGRGSSVELTPRSPDPRAYYRADDVPAASHRPLAACMARLGGRSEGEVVWDPFCGSGLELIERAMLGGVRLLHGTDSDPAAIAIARENVAAAQLPGVQASFTCCDFRDDAALTGVGAGNVSLIITNPPMGKRVPVPDLHGLIQDLVKMGARVLRPGGRLVFVNPLRKETSHPSLKREYLEPIDLGGFNCRLEMYVRV